MVSSDYVITFSAHLRITTSLLGFHVPMLHSAVKMSNIAEFSVKGGRAFDDVSISPKSGTGLTECKMSLEELQIILK